MNSATENIAASPAGAPQLPGELRWRVRDLAAALLLLVVFFILERPTFQQPYFWDGSYAADTASRILRGHLNPVMKDYRDQGHPVLIQELYAAGWLVLGDHQIWWPHVVAFALCFLTLLYSYRIGVWLGSPLVGLAAAILMMLDPLFLAQAGSIILAAPSFGFATVTLYYLLTDRPRRFAIAGSLTALTYIPTDIFLLCLIGMAVLIYGSRRDWRRLAWCLIPGFVLAAWLVFHRLAYGYFVAHPAFWIAGERSVLLNREGLAHIHINLYEVFLRDWRLPFTIVAFGGGLFYLVMLLARRAATADSLAARWYERMGGAKAGLLLLALAVSVIVYLPLISVTSGHVLLGRYLLIMIVPLFLLTVQFLYATRIAWLWIGGCIALGWLLRSHWYDPKEPWRYNREETLLYRRVVRTEVAATRFLTTYYPSATVLATFPHALELSDPDLDYVSRPMKVKWVEDVTPDTPVDLVYYSSVTGRTQQEKMLKLIDRQGARPVQRYAYGDVETVLLKTGENLNAPENRYSGMILNPAYTAAPGQTFSVLVALENLGRNPWAENSDVNVSYHWERDGKALPDEGNLRTPLPHDQFWGESVLLPVRVRAPQQPGRYTLAVDMLQENVMWFASAGNTPIRTDIDVQGP